MEIHPHLRERKRNGVPYPVAVVVVVLVLTISVSASAQAIDPFYLNRLQAGENLLLAKLYGEALKELGVAAFGLSSDKVLLAKTYVLMSLSHARLSQNDRAGETLRAASSLVGWDALSEIAVPEPFKPDLAKLIAGAKGTPPASEKPLEKPQAKDKPAPAPPTPAISSAAGENSVKPPPDVGTVERLKREIQENPRDARPSYALALHLAQNGDFSNARKTLQEFLAKNPAEIRAYLEIGKIEYQARKLKDAERSLEKFLELTASRPMDQYLLDEARALIILSAYLRGDGKKTRLALESAGDLFRPERLAALTLEAKDIDRLLTIWSTSEKK